MYLIYKIGYEISDEIKRRKENEKPFYWDHIHPEIKDLSEPEVDKYLLDGGLAPEKIKELSKHMKYLIVSEGLYAVQIKELEANNVAAIATAATASSSAFLDTGSKLNPDSTIPALAEPVPAAGEPPTIAPLDEFEPMAFGAKPAVPGTEPIIQGLGTEPVIPSGGSAANGGVAGQAPVDPLIVNKESRQIVKSAIEQINTQSGGDPDKLEAMLASVVFELNKVKNHQ